MVKWESVKSKILQEYVWGAEELYNDDKNVITCQQIDLPTGNASWPQFHGDLEKCDKYLPKKVYFKKNLI